MTAPIVYKLSSSIAIEKYDRKFIMADFVLRQFPDGETYIKNNTEIENCEVIILESLDNPNAKMMPLLLLAKTLREQGAGWLRLAVPYLPYLRQDKIFHPGEGLTSKYFAELLSTYVDDITTVDPHLHRYKTLDEIYTVTGNVLHATGEIARYIKNTVKNPVIIGPDGESEQWAKEIADKVGAPMIIAHKKRQGDYDVEMELPGMEQYISHTPVLIDDIISTAQTMIEATTQLKKLKCHAPICIGVHAIFAGKAYENLKKAGVEKIITCNTISHESNGIDLTDLIALAL